MRRFTTKNWQAWVFILVSIAGLAEVGRYAFTCACPDFWDILAMALLITILSTLLYQMYHRKKFSKSITTLLSITSFTMVMQSLFYLETSLTNSQDALVMLVVSGVLLVTALSMHAPNHKALAVPIKTPHKRKHD
jgi:hypothetical protein